MRSVVFCGIQELKAQGMVTRWLDEARDEITALHREGRIYVLSTVCPHRGGDFLLNDGALQCKWHGRRYDFRNGVCLTYAEEAPLRRYDYLERGDNLEVLLP